MNENPYASPQTLSERAAMSPLEWCGNAAGNVAAVFVTLLLFFWPSWVVLVGIVGTATEAIREGQILQWQLNRLANLSGFMLVAQVAWLCAPMILLSLYESVCNWRYRRWRKRFDAGEFQ